jgi:hypothetical protein
MSSFGVARLKDIRKMLDNCAPGHKFEPKTHNIWVMWNGKKFASLPKGGHGEDNPEIQLGKVKQMINQLNISLACAKQYLPLK